MSMITKQQRTPRLPLCPQCHAGAVQHYTVGHHLHRIEHPRCGLRGPDSATLAHALAALGLGVAVQPVSRIGAARRVVQS